MIEFLESLFIQTWARLQARPQRPVVEKPRTEDGKPVGYLIGSGSPVYLTWREVVRMLLVTGITGAGKSTFLKRMVEAVWPETSVVLFDAHQDFSRWLVRFAAAVLGPEEAVERLVVIDPTASSEYITPANPLAGHGDPLQRTLLVLGALRKLAQDQFGGWGVTIQQNLMYALLALAEAGVAEKLPYSLAHLQPFFLREAFRASVLKHCSESVCSYWQESFDRLSADQQLQSWLFIQNKISGLLLPLGDLFSPRRGFSFDILNAPPSKIVICAIPQHRFEDAAVVGIDLLVSTFHNFVMSRADLPPEQKRPVLCIVDEFPQLMPDRFQSLIELARKHNVAVALGAQSLGILPPATRHVLRNIVGNTVALRQGPDSAKDIARSIFPADSGEDVARVLMAQKQGEGYLCQVDKPAMRFRVRHAPDPDIDEETLQRCLSASLQAHGQTRADFAAERANFAAFLNSLETGSVAAPRRPAAHKDLKETFHERTPGEYRPKAR